MQRRHFSLALLAATSPLAARAATEGREYTRLQQPVPVAVPGKVEVMEFFGYWCPHCNALEPELEAWVRKLPADVNFRRMPPSALGQDHDDVPRGRLHLQRQALVASPRCWGRSSRRRR
jgi:thiol-disulfide isomerase/thioredoxin